MKIASVAEIPAMAMALVQFGMDEPGQFRDLDHREVTGLLMNFFGLRGNRGFEKEELRKILAWAQEVKVTQKLLHFAVEGAVSVDVKDGKLSFTAPPGEDQVVG